MPQKHFDVPNPPSSSEITPADAQIHQALNDTEVEQIVIFYKTEALNITILKWILTKFAS